jgi:hypothetical protein
MSGIDTNPLSESFSLGLQNPANRAGDLMDTINRQADQLDTFNDKLSFIANGLFSFSWAGGAGAFGVQSFQHGLGYAPIYLAYYNLSTDSLWRPCDDLLVDNTGLVTFEAYCNTDTTYVTGNYNALVAGTPATVTIKWFLLREPASQAAA